MFGALLAYGVMRPGGLGWHWYLGLAAIPLAVVLLFFPVRFACSMICFNVMPMVSMFVVCSLFQSLHGTMLLRERI